MPPMYNLIEQRWKMTSELVKNIAETAAGYFGAPSLSVSVISRGEKFEASLGCTQRTVFQIGEISKTFLCSALRTSGIDTDRPVADISPWFRMSSEELTRQVTLKDIILQRTGLPPHEASWFFNPQLSYRELTGRIRYLDTAFGLRDRWCRQDHLFAAASCVLEDVTGKKWNSYCMDQTIKPARLASTFCSVADMEESGYQDVAAAHLSAYGQTAEVSLWMTDLLAGGGSMLSCIEDKDTLLLRAGEKVPVHEFHYWDTTADGTDMTLTKVSNGKQWNFGYAGETLYAGFPHLYLGGGQLAERFVSACRR